MTARTTLEEDAGPFCPSPLEGEVRVGGITAAWTNGNSDWCYPSVFMRSAPSPHPDLPLKGGGAKRYVKAVAPQAGEGTPELSSPHFSGGDGAS